MSDTEEPVSGDKATLSGKAHRESAKQSEKQGETGNPGKPTDQADYQASFHPDTETRFATLGKGAADKPGNTASKHSGQQDKLKDTDTDTDTDKEKALSKTSSSSIPMVTAVIAVLIALAAAGGVAYLWNESRVEKAKLAFENNSLQAGIAAQNAKLDALQTTIGGLAKELEDTEAFAVDVKANNQKLDGRVAAIESEIAEMTGSSRIDWMLREVEHFVMVAERRLSLLGDVDGALALMNEADQLVREMAEPAARPLRNTIQSDLMTLQEASDVSVDTEGLFSRISLLSEQVPELRSASINYEMSLSAREEVAAPPQDGLGYVWYEIKRFLSSLVRVQRVTDSEIKPLLLQDQQIFVEQNIRLLLEQAQLALLRGDQLVYETSLGEVQSRVREYLRTDTAKANAFLKNIAELKAATVKPEVPSIEDSVRAVQVFRDYWQKEKVERQLGTAAIENAVDDAAVPETDASAPAADTVDDVDTGSEQPVTDQ